MTYPQTALSTPLSIPILGLNKRDPLAAMPQGFATEILNFEPEAQYLKLRKGYVRHGDTGDTSDLLLGLGVYANTSGLYAFGTDASNLNRITIWDVLSASPFTIAHATTSTTVSLPRGVSYRGGTRMAFFASSGAGGSDLMYNGTSWGTTGFTYLGSPIDICNTGIPYKGRFYIAGYEGTNAGMFYSSTVGGWTGAMDLLDLRTIFGRSSDVVNIGVLTAPSGSPVESFICFFSDAGEVLIYSGEYPAASNWALVGQYQIPPLLTQCPPIEIQNDIWCFTRAGVISIRRLLEGKGDILNDVSPSSYINPIWNRLVQEHLLSVGDFGIQADFVSWAFNPEQNKIYILMQGFLGSDGVYVDNTEASTIFTYHLVSQAWTISKISNAGDGARALTYFKGTLYYLTGNTVMKMSDSVYKDETWNSANTFTEYPYELHSAYTALNASSVRKRVTGVDLLIKTDFDGSNVGVQIASDFGRKVSSTSNQSLQDGHNNVTYNVGVDGTYLQYRLTGTSDSASTDGLELYSVGLNIK